MSADTHKYSYEGSDSHGLPVWSCTRPGGGISGYGHTPKDALAAFLDLEDEIVPTHQEIETEAAIDDYLHEEAFGDQA